MFPHAAGIDVGAPRHCVALRPNRAGGVVERGFGVMSDRVHQVARWPLRPCGGCPEGQARTGAQRQRARLPAATAANELRFVAGHVPCGWRRRYAVGDFAPAHGIA